jgi:hypothetical protein
MNIKEVFRNNKLIGYRVYRKIDGQLNQKYFTSQKNTIEKNLELSQEYLFSLKHKLEYNNINFGNQIYQGEVIYNEIIDKDK